MTVECCPKRALERAGSLEGIAQNSQFCYWQIKNNNCHLLNTYWVPGTGLRALHALNTWSPQACEVLPPSPSEHHWFLFCLWCWVSGIREELSGVHLWCTWRQLGWLELGIPFQMALSLCSWAFLPVPTWRLILSVPTWLLIQALSTWLSFLTARSSQDITLLTWLLASTS